MQIAYDFLQIRDAIISITEDYNTRKSFEILYGKNIGLLVECSLMSPVVSEIEKALLQLPEGERWEIACWLLETLRQKSVSQPESVNSSIGPKKVQTMPDYAERRRQIFGEKVLPNMILESRSQERW